MNRIPVPRMTWLVVTLFAVAFVALDLPNRMFSHIAFAMQQGRIQADTAELARIEEISHAFRLVARIAQPGVVNIHARPGEREETEWEELREREAELELRRDRLEALLDQGDQPDRDAVWELLSQLRDIERQRERLHDRLVPGTGSGIIFDEQGHILTNNHVVDNRSEIRVQLGDGREYAATLIGADPESDLALIKIDAGDLHPLTFGDSDQAQVGDWVIAVGAPFGLTQSVTHGIISARGRTNIDTGEREIVYQDFIQTDAAINPGNSGGPLLNLRGEVIGVNTAIATNGDAYNAGIAFTIPSNMAVKIAERLRASGEVARGWLGVTMGTLEPEDFDVFAAPRGGVMVTGVLSGSPAEAAGFAVEDVVVEINGHPIRTNDQMLAVVADVFPGEQADFEIIRAGQPLQLHIELGRRPADVRAARLNSDFENALTLAALGARVQTLRPSVAVMNGFDAGDRGVFIAALGELPRGAVTAPVTAADGEAPRNGGADARASRTTDSHGLQLGDLVVQFNDTPVATAGQLLRLFEQMQPGRQFKLTVKNRETGTRTLTLRR